MREAASVPQTIFQPGLQLAANATPGAPKTPSGNFAMATQENDYRQLIGLGTHPQVGHAGQFDLDSWPGARGRPTSTGRSSTPAAWASSAKGHPRIDGRQVIDGMLLKAEAGIAWRDLSDQYAAASSYSSRGWRSSWQVCRSCGGILRRGWVGWLVGRAASAGGKAVLPAGAVACAYVRGLLASLAGRNRRTLAELPGTRRRTACSGC